MDTKRNVEANIKLNRLEGVAEFLPLNWGDMCVPERLLRVLETVDLVLAADCFYNSEGGAFHPSPSVRVFPK